MGPRVSVIRRVLGGCLVTSGLLIASAGIADDPQIVWLQSQQAPSGLVDSYEGDGQPRAYTYDQALAAIAFTHAGQLINARQTLDRMVLLQRPDGSWYTGYDLNGIPISSTTDTGPTAWMAIAVNYYEASTRDRAYEASLTKVLDLLAGRMDTNP